VFPVREYEKERLGTGSLTQLTLHTEDAFHPYRADYVILAALRNPDRSPTTISELDPDELDEADLDLLLTECFEVIPDTSHLPKNNTATSADESAYFRSIERLMAADRRVAVLFGSRARPFLRFDETYMRAPVDDAAAGRAFAAVRALLLRRRLACPVDAGDLLFLNNHRVVHGREPFTPRYDGTDRWLKRVNVTTDLRKSADMRGRLGPRLVG